MVVVANSDVFINWPFDDDYRPLFNAFVFTVVRSGFRVRCALEADDGTENRFGKISKIIAECKYGIHDISRTDAGGTPPLPRFNMPLELGVFLGAKRYGNRAQREKSCINFDRERYRYQRFMSDIAGQDIHAHHGDERRAIIELASWLRAQSGYSNIPGGHAIAEEYRVFLEALPTICANRSLATEELTFGDYNDIVVGYLTV